MTDNHKRDHRNEIKARHLRFCIRNMARLGPGDTIVFDWEVFADAFGSDACITKFRKLFGGNYTVETRNGNYVVTRLARVANPTGETLHTSIIRLAHHIRVLSESPDDRPIEQQFDELSEVAVELELVLRGCRWLSVANGDVVGSVELDLPALRILDNAMARINFKTPTQTEIHRKLKLVREDAELGVTGERA